MLFKYYLFIFCLLAGGNDGSFPLRPHIQTGSGTHPASYAMGTGIFPRGESIRCLKLTTHFHLVPRLRMRSYTSIPQYVFMAWCLIKHRTRLWGVTLS